MKTIRLHLTIPIYTEMPLPLIHGSRISNFMAAVVTKTLAMCVPIWFRITKGSFKGEVTQYTSKEGGGYVEFPDTEENRHRLGKVRGFLGIMEKVGVSVVVEGA